MSSHSCDTNELLEVLSMYSEYSDDESELKSNGFEVESVNKIDHDEIKDTLRFSIHMTIKEFDKLEKSDKQNFFEYLLSQKDITKNFFCKYNAKACSYEDFIYIKENKGEFCYFNGISEEKNCLWFYYHSVDNNIYEISYIGDLHNKLHVWGINNYI
jgi:hypothetical protein